MKIRNRRRRREAYITNIIQFEDKLGEGCKCYLVCFSDGREVPVIFDPDGNRVG